MDALTFLLACLIGIGTGLVPGLHVNTLAALALALLSLERDVALALVVVGTVHTVVTILPTTYLGAPGEDTAIAMLPAHELLRQGRGPEAIRLSVVASTLAMVAVILLLLPVKWLLAAPLHGAEKLTQAAPWILGGVLLLLLWQERMRGHRGVLAAAAVMALAGLLGWRAWDWPVQNPWRLPASPLLPLLTGLFAVPGLRHAAHATMPSQASPPPHVPAGTWRAVLRGTSVAAGTAVLPGLTAAVATAITQAGRGAASPRQVIAVLSAVNTAHHGFALCMLWLVGATRSGLADATRGALRTPPWDGALPVDLHAVLFVALAATLVGASGTLALERVLRRTMAHVPGRILHAIALAIIIGVVAALTGAWGLLLLVVAAAIGEIPLTCGIRRVHLAACLIVPVILTRL